jgi:hypothetical protein
MHTYDLHSLLVPHCHLLSCLQGSALCVDIQGVGDLYTDPQIHTLDGQGYGDGNLALRGEYN